MDIEVVAFWVVMPYHYTTSQSRPLLELFFSENWMRVSIFWL